MIKIKESNRGIFFLGATVLIGVSLIIVLVFNKPPKLPPIDYPKPTKDSTFKILENDIKTFKFQAFNPSNYFTLLTNISSNFEQGLITPTVKNNLVLNLNEDYSELIYNQCELYLKGDDSHQNEEILRWLGQLEGIPHTNNRINLYRDQIKQYEYYSVSLPKKVSEYIARGQTNFIKELHLAYKNEVLTMPNLDRNYFYTPKLQEVRKNLIPSLDTLYELFYGQKN